MMGEYSILKMACPDPQSPNRSAGMEGNIRREDTVSRVCVTERLQSDACYFSCLLTKYNLRQYTDKDESTLFG